MSDAHSYFYYKPVSNHNVIEHAVTFSDKLLCCDQTTTTATTSNHHNDSVSYLVLAKNTILELCQVHKTNGVIHTIFQQNMFGKVMRIGCLIVGDECDDERDDHRREFLIVLSSNRDGGAFLHALTVNSASNCFEFFGDATIPLNSSESNNDERNGDYNGEENDGDAYFMSVDANGRAIVVASLLRSTIYVHPVIANFTGVMMTRMNNNNNNDEKLFDSTCSIQVPMDKNASDGTSMVIWHIECLSSTETELYVAVVGTVNHDRNSVLIYRIDFRERTFEKVLYCDTKQSFYRSVSSYYEESLTQHVLRVPSQPNLLLIIHGSELLLTRWRDEHNGRVLPQLELLSRETYQPTTEMVTASNDNNMATHDDTEGGNENENENTSNDENQTADSPTGNHYPRTNSGQCILTAAYDWSKDSISEHCSTLILTTENGTMFECRVEHKYSPSLRLRRILNVDCHTSMNVVVSLQHKPNEKLVWCSGEMCNSTMYEIIEDDNRNLNGQALSSRANLCPVIDFETYYQNYYSMEEEAMGNIVPGNMVIQNRNERKTLVCTATNNSKSESMRIVRRAIGIEAISISDEQFSGLNGLWTLKSELKLFANHSFVVLGFLSETRVLMRSEDGFEDVSIASLFDIHKRTLLCDTVGNLTFVQVTSNTVRIIQFEFSTLNGQLTSKVLCEWSSDQGSISVACYKQGHLLLSMSQGSIVKRLRIDPHTFAVKEEANTVLSDDASSFEMIVHHDEPSASIAFVGAYNGTIQVLSLETLQHVSHSEPFTNGNSNSEQSITIVQSMLVDRNVLYVGLRDGTLLLYSITYLQNQALLKKILSRKIGLLPVSLVATDYGKVIATSNTTFVIKQLNDRVRNEDFDMVMASTGRVLFLVPFNNTTSLSSPPSVSREEESFIAVSAEDFSMDIYILDYSQPMNTCSIPVKGASRRVLLSKQFYATSFVLCDGSNIGSNDGSFYIEAINLVTRESTVIKQFLNEKPFCICEWTINTEPDDTSPRHFIVVGTQLLSTYDPLRPTLNADDAQEQNRRGNVHMFELKRGDTDRVIQCVRHYALALPDVAMSVHVLSPKYLAVSAGHRIVLIHHVLDEQPSLQPSQPLIPVSQNICRHFIQSISSYDQISPSTVDSQSTHDRIIAVTDRYDGVSLFQFNESAKTLQFLENERIARSCASALMVDQELIVGVDRDGAFFAVRHDTDEQASNQHMLSNSAYFNMHETALTIKPLVRHYHDHGHDNESTPNNSNKKRHLTCVTVCGSIINFLEVTHIEYGILYQVQQLLSSNLINGDRSKGRRAHLLSHRAAATSGKDSSTITSIEAYRSGKSIDFRCKRVVDGEFITDRWTALNNDSKQSITETVIQTSDNHQKEYLAQHSIEDMLNRLNRI